MDGSQPAGADRLELEQPGRRTVEARILQHVSSLINSTLHLDRIFDIVLTTMDEIFGFRHSLILLLDDSGETLTVVASRGYDEPPTGAKVTVGTGLIGVVAKRRRTMRISNLSQQRAYAAAIRAEMQQEGRESDLQQIPELPGLRNGESQIAIPLLIEDKLIGVFSVESEERRVFSDQDEILMSIVANQAASSIQNARLFQAEANRRRELADHNLALIHLARSQALALDDQAAFLRDATETVAETVHVERCSVWAYAGNRGSIQLLDLFDRQMGEHSAGAELAARDFPAYFQSLSGERVIAAHDAHRDPRTAEFSANYLTPLGITSMLDAPIHVAGEMIGVICLESVGPMRHWTLEEETFGASVADLVALSIEGQRRRRAETEIRILARFPEENPSPVLRVAADLTILYANAPSQPLLDAAGTKVGGPAPSDWRETIAEVLRLGVGKGMETSYGDAVFYLNLAPVVEAGYVNIYGLDITARKRAEEEILKSQKLLKNAQTMANLGVFEWDVAENRVTWSEELYRIFGASAEQFDSTFDAFLGRVHDDDREKVRRVIEEAYRGHGAFAQEERIVRPDGSMRVLASKGEIVRDESGRPIKVLGICQDITERKETERLLEEYSRTLEEKVETRTRELRENQTQLVQSGKMAALGSLAAGLAHEINTPLGAMVGNSDITSRLVRRMKSLLQDRKEVPEAKRQADLVALANSIEEIEVLSRTAGARITRIVSSLKNFAHLDQAVEDEVDLHEGIESALALVQHLLRDRITVKREFGDIPRIRCSPGQMNQVFMNLILNAIQAIEGAGEVTIRTFAQDARVVVEISDDGVGIPDEHLHRIFDPGFTTKGVKVGTGLGLSIAFRIVENHGGTIEVESEPGVGSTFRVKLPIAS
jgi:PAS domain S-box-containing protein